MDNPDQATRREAWGKILSEQEASGLSQAAFCKKHNLPLPRFSYYRSALRGSRKKSRPSTPEFEPVKLKSVPESVMPSSDIQLLFPNGIKVTFPPDIDIDTIKQLMEALIVC